MVVVLAAAAAAVACCACSKMQQREWKGGLRCRSMEVYKNAEAVKRE